MVEENTQILKSIQRAGRISLGLKILYWVIILGFTFGAYYFIQPYINAIRNAADTVPEGASTFNAFSPSGVINSFENLKDIYEN